MNPARRPSRRTPRISLVPPAKRHERIFLEAVRRSARLHGRYASAPATSAAYRALLARLRDDRHVGRLVLDAETEEIAGVVNLNEIVRGSFQSAYLGYYALVPFERRGYMEAGLRAVVRLAWKEFGLHRLEANIQPDNARSIALVRRLGFRLEGLSPRYLKLAGRWRDHERWAITREDPLRPLHRSQGRADSRSGPRPDRRSD